MFPTWAPVSEDTSIHVQPIPVITQRLSDHVDHRSSIHKHPGAADNSMGPASLLHNWLGSQ